MITPKWQLPFKWIPSILIAHGLPRLKSNIIWSIVKYETVSKVTAKLVGSLSVNEEIRKLIDTEIQGIINAHNGFKLFEKISRFVLIGKAFEVGVELSAKQEIMRHKVSDIYSKEINSLFK